MQVYSWTGGEVLAYIVGLLLLGIAAVAVRMIFEDDVDSSVRWIAFFVAIVTALSGTYLERYGQTGNLPPQPTSDRVVIVRTRTIRRRSGKTSYTVTEYTVDTEREGRFVTEKGRSCFKPGGLVKINIFMRPETNELKAKEIVACGTQ